ncbi:MAG: DUF92 domain-containing protein [Myxococcales bacterium]|nr:DUF92 domain-containing protein [Myxococcales bacterium]
MFADAVAEFTDKDDEPYILKYDLDSILVLALLRPAGRQSFTLEELERGFRTVTKMLHGRRERLPVARFRSSALSPTPSSVRIPIPRSPRSRRCSPRCTARDSAAMSTRIIISTPRRSAPFSQSAGRPLAQLEPLAVDRRRVRDARSLPVVPQPHRLDLHAVAPHPDLFWGFLGAFAAAAADTWATEVGTLVRAPTRSIWTGKRMLPGESGGVSLPGTAAAVVGAFTIFLPLVVAPAVFVDRGVAGPMFAVVLGGVAASLVDSVLGATVQALYRDPAGGVSTERPTDRGKPNELVRGWRWMNNDMVNFACTAAGAAFAVGLLRLSS